MEIAIIQNKILEIRGQKVLLDRDLAEMYGVETRILKQTVKRNFKRFRGNDFMFQLTDIEINDMVSQFVIPSKKQLGGAFPFAFTELGVAMLSSVLNSETAIETNRNIMRAFVMIRQFALNYKELADKLCEMEEKYDRQFANITEAIDYLLQKDKIEIEQKERRRIGFVRYDEE